MPPRGNGAVVTALAMWVWYFARLQGALAG